MHPSLLLGFLISESSSKLETDGDKIYKSLWLRVLTFSFRIWLNYKSIEKRDVLSNMLHLLPKCYCFYTIFSRALWTFFLNDSDNKLPVFPFGSSSTV